MKSAGSRAALRGTLAVVLLWLVAFSLACRLAEPQPGAGLAGYGILGAMLGSARSAVSGRMYLEADRYFHKGRGHYVKTGLDNRLQALARAITPEKVTHLHGDEAADVVPWLVFAMRSDPHNVDPYLSAAFFLDRELRRSDLAEQVLAEARRHNPSDYRIQLERGRFLLMDSRVTEAYGAFQAALKLWPGTAQAGVPDEEQRLLDKAEIMMYLGLVSETVGRMQDAAALYRQVLELFPGRENLVRRLAQIESAGRPETEASALWRAILVSKHHACEHDHGEHGPEDHEHDEHEGQEH